ncbi:hypothetical protein D3C76_1301840 [compost metagenome]
MDGVGVQCTATLFFVTLLATAGHVLFEQGAAETLWSDMIDGQIGMLTVHLLLANVTAVPGLRPYFLLHAFLVLAVDLKLKCVVIHP